MCLQGINQIHTVNQSGAAVNMTYWIFVLNSFAKCVRNNKLLYYEITVCVIQTRLVTNFESTQFGNIMRRTT